MKNAQKRDRTGGAPSPYTKRAKRPCDYSSMYSRYPNLLRRPAVSSFGFTQPAEAEFDER